MMNLNNASSSSLGSHKQKDLPPVPPQESSLSPHESSLRSVGKSEESILSVKSLKRKNFKNLSLNPAPPPDDEVSLKLDSMSLREKRNTVRPAPLLNLNDSNFNVKPFDADSKAPTDNIMTQISGLEQPSHKAQAAKVIRKRQTVISSISPTKSTSSSVGSPKETDDSSSPVFATTSTIRFNSKDLVTLKNLGSGNSGTVSKILHIPTQKIMAKKTIPIESKVVIQNQIIRELKILHECQSPYIIEFYGAFLNNNNTIVICMEYGNCGSLDKILGLCNPRQFPLFVLKKLTFSILSGLVYLYSVHKIIHRDIKPSNVLMTHKGDFKLCDFGVSRELTNSLAMADTFVGTSTYMSPERIQGLNYGIKSDVWSTGLMLIELATGKSLWSDNDDDSDANADKNGPEGILDLLQRIVNETPPSLANKINPTTNEKYDKDLCDFIDSCLVKDDVSRKSPFDLLGSNFLKGVEAGAFNKEVKIWAKNIRKLHKEKHEKS